MPDEGRERCPRCDRFVARKQMTREHVRPRFLDNVPSGVFRICVDCNMNASKEQAEDSSAYKRSANKERYKAFLSAVHEIEALLLVRIPDERLAQSFTRILFASVITSMETYLADTFLFFSLNNPALLRRCVEQIPDLKERKLDLGTIFGRYESIGQEVRVSPPQQQGSAASRWHRCWLPERQCPPRCAAPSARSSATSSACSAAAKFRCRASLGFSWSFQVSFVWVSGFSANFALNPCPSARPGRQMQGLPWPRGITRSAQAQRGRPGIRPWPRVLTRALACARGGAP
jgi:hypothetical protein